MLSLSRAGGVPLSHVDLGPTVAELQRILGQVLPPSIDLRVSVPPGLTAWTNGAFLQSALLNLALNARDAMPEGGVLTIRAEPIRWEPHVTPLAVGQLPSMDCVDLSVCDTGSGIAPGLMARIFDPLFSTKAKQRGHGLGLFMVEELVTRSGAGLAVESELKVGTRFRLLLPREETGAPLGGAEGPGSTAGSTTGSVPAPRTSRANDTRPAPLAGLRVLVVDDAPRVRESVARLLALDGASFSLADQGQAGLDLLERDGPFDLVLSDIAMPVLDGIQLLRRLAQVRPDLAVILMTGQEGALIGLDEPGERPLVLRKPLDPATLRAAVLARVGNRLGPNGFVPG
jgi:CheY-like chemotaxis protein